MKFGNLVSKSLSAAVVLLWALAAQAEPVRFFGSDPNANGSFPSNPDSPPLVAQRAFANLVTAGVQREGFETTPTGFISNVPPLDTRNVFGTSGSTLTQTPIDPFGPNLAGVEVRNGSKHEGRFNTTNGASSGGFIESDRDFTIQLGAGLKVAAFGFFGTDFGDFDGNLQIELWDGNTRVLANAFTDAQGGPLSVRGTNMVPNDGTLLFFGFASDSFVFDRMVFKISQGSTNFDTLGFDDFVIGNVPTGGGTIPEPASIALVGLALSGLAAARSRRTRPS